MQSSIHTTHAPSCSYTLPVRSQKQPHHSRYCSCCPRSPMIHPASTLHPLVCQACTVSEPFVFCRSPRGSGTPSPSLIRLCQHQTQAASRLVANSATLTRNVETSLPQLNIQQPAGTADKVGVLLLNLGGPETLDDVEHFLFNLFNDPDIIRLPGQGTTCAQFAVCCECAANDPLCMRLLSPSSSLQDRAWRHSLQWQRCILTTLFAASHYFALIASS